MAQQRKSPSARTKIHKGTRAKVYVRDGCRCLSCGWTPPVEGLVFKTNYRGDNYLTIDHIVARADGGSNLPSNMQTLCNICNGRKASAKDLRIRERAARRRQGRVDSHHLLPRYQTA